MATSIAQKTKPVRLNTKAGALANMFPTGGGKTKSKDSTSTAGTVSHKAGSNKVGRR